MNVGTWVVVFRFFPGAGLFPSNLLVQEVISVSVVVASVLVVVEVVGGDGEDKYAPNAMPVAKAAMAAAMVFIAVVVFQCPLLRRYIFGVLVFHGTVPLPTLQRRS
jgi:zinc transporter ZupT